jgi:hypothetical protein
MSDIHIRIGEEPLSLLREEAKRESRTVANMVRVLLAEALAMRAVRLEREEIKKKAAKAA